MSSTNRCSSGLKCAQSVPTYRIRTTSQSTDHRQFSVCAKRPLAAAAEAPTNFEKDAAATSDGSGAAGHSQTAAALGLYTSPAVSNPPLPTAAGGNTGAGGGVSPDRAAAAAARWLVWVLPGRGGRSIGCVKPHCLADAFGESEEEEEEEEDVAQTERANHEGSERLLVLVVPTMQEAGHALERRQPGAARCLVR